MTSVLLRDAVDRWASVQPDAPAVTFGDQRYDWEQWRERILRLTGALRSAGVGPGNRVAVLDLNHLAGVELTLAASSLGAATVVLNFRSSPDQIRYVMEDSRPVIAFHGALFGSGALEAVPRRIVIDDGYEPFLAAGQPDEGAPVDPDDVCLVLYTSGTTGQSKGAQLTHRGVSTHGETCNAIYQMGPGDTHLVSMPLFHVGGSCAIQVGILAGAHSILLREPTPEAIFGAVAGGASHAFFVPAIIGRVLAAGDAAIAAFGGLTSIAYGASPMPLPMLRRALEAWPRLKFIQVYGMTELSGTVIMLAPEAHRDETHPERLGSAGLPVLGAEIRIVDPATSHDVKSGETGEIWVRTAQVMRGYLNRAEATAETKTPDGWLRTGDIGRTDDAGFVYILDRLKDMIITGGENVYSPEVENVLNACPGVAEGVIIGVPDERWGEAIKAIVVATLGARLEATDVIEFCRARLAHYQCPASVEFVDELPRGATGKVLKRTLRAPYWADKDRSI